MSERSCETCKYQTRIDPCPKCWREPGKPSWTAKRSSTLEVLRGLRDEIRKNEKDVVFANTGWYNGSRSAHHKDADLIDVEIKRLEEPEQKP